MALLASMSEDERYAVMKKLKKMAKEQEREQKVRGKGVTHTCALFRLFDGAGKGPASSLWPLASVATIHF